MKVNCQEHEHGFWFEFEPETMEDQLFVTRFGLNATVERVLKGASVNKDGMYAYLSLSKRKQPLTAVRS
jgi:hypothetical protein